MRGITFNRFEQIWYQVKSSFQLDVDLAPCISHLVALVDKAAVSCDCVNDNAQRD